MATGQGQGAEAGGPQQYLCTTGLLFLKRSADPKSGQIVKVKRTAGAEIRATGLIWTGPSGGVWAELDASSGEGGWALVRGPGFGLDGPALVDAGGRDAAREAASDTWPTHPRDDDDWQGTLSPRRYAILREKETEPMNSGEYNKFFPASGHFKCAGCEEALYSAGSKYNSGCGWPAFSTCYQNAAGLPRVVVQVDWQVGGREILCRRCGGHLGHVFMDGMATGGSTAERHCVNSLSVLYDGAGAPPPGPGSGGPPREGLCDHSTFKRQMREHTEHGTYSKVA